MTKIAKISRFFFFGRARRTDRNVQTIYSFHTLHMSVLQVQKIFYINAFQENITIIVPQRGIGCLKVKRKSFRCQIYYFYSFERRYFRRSRFSFQCTNIISRCLFGMKNSYPKSQYSTSESANIF